MSKRHRDESERICNLRPSRHTESDWGFAEASAGAVELSAGPPASVDLRAKWWDIGNQANTGSCVGWASTDGLMRWHLHKGNRLPTSGRVSVRATWMGSKETDVFVSQPTTFIDSAGTSLKAAVDILRKFGSVDETALPFDNLAKLYVGTEATFYTLAGQRRISAYFNLGRNLTNWKIWLANHGPVMVGLNVDATWDGATATKGELKTFKPSTVRGGHAVCAVGYRADGAIIIRNSWGTAWGDKGFAYAHPSYISAGFFDESYGVVL